MDSSEIEWTITSQPPVMSGEDVHIWHIDLRDPAGAQPGFNELLSVDERKRAHRFHFEKDRRSFVKRRAALRMILGSYVRGNPEDLQFTYNIFDRPELDTKLPISFSTSSSNGVGLVAIALDTRIGIDIEFVDELFPITETTEKYFSAPEVSAIRNLHPELQAAAFFDCWTKKEAYVKAIGEGMSHPLPDLKILSNDNDLFTVDAISTSDTTGWCISSFVPQNDYIASISYEGKQRTVRFFDWQMK